MNNKKKIIIISIVLILVVVLVILGIYFINNKEKTYENVRIISDVYNNTEPSGIIYDNKEYTIKEDDYIYSIKNYNGKLYYYKSYDLCNYFMLEGNIEVENDIFYEFGRVILNEQDLTYSFKPIKEITYNEYKNGNKEEIKYCVDNIEGKFGFEINRSYVIFEEDGITIENFVVNEKEGEYLQVYTKKDENNNVIWTYKTEIEVFGQCDTIQKLEITNDRIYINEHGIIVVLNKENGKVLWKNTNAENFIIGSHYLDEKQNLYIFADKYPYLTLYIMDKNGKEKAAISSKLFGDYEMGEGPDVKKVNAKELLLECSAITHNGPESYDVLINLKDYSVKKVIKR